MRSWTLIPLIIFVGLSTIACRGVTTMAPYHFTYDIHEELQPHLDSFIQEGKLRGINLRVTNIIMKFVPNFPGKPFKLAECRYGRINVISVSQEFWNWAQEETREQIVYHELGHCVLGRDHVHDSVDYQGQIIPKSLMEPNLFSDYYYHHYRTYYVDELFGR